MILMILIIFFFGEFDIKFIHTFYVLLKIPSTSNVLFFGRKLRIL